MKSFLVFVAAFTLIAVAAPAQEGLDNAADAAYDAGWNYGDNGGSGFNAWIFNSLYDVTFATDATTAGGEGVMNTGGRCFQVRFDPGLGSVNASIYRTISTSGNTSDVLRLDIQSILTGESTVVADFYGGGNRIGYLIGVGNVANYTMEDGGGATDTGIPINKPIRLLYKLLGSTTHQVEIRTLTGPPITFTSGPRTNLVTPVLAITQFELFARSGDVGDSAIVLLNNFVYDAGGDNNVLVPVSVSRVLIE